MRAWLFLLLLAGCGRAVDPAQRKANEERAAGHLRSYSQSQSMFRGAKDRFAAGPADRRWPAGCRAVLRPGGSWPSARLSAGGVSRRGGIEGEEMRRVVQRHEDLRRRPRGPRPPVPPTRCARRQLANHELDDHIHAKDIPKVSKGYRPARPTWRRRPPA